MTFGPTDALPPEALSGVDLPTATLALLTTGIPRELSLPGWLGPTLFSSELSGGQLTTVAARCGLLADDPVSTAQVVGSVRETMGQPTTHAVFCLLPTGALWLVDLHAPFHQRHVNADLGAFLRSAALLVTRWPSIAAADDACITATGDELRAALRAIDPTAFADDDRYWPTLIETILDLP